MTAPRARVPARPGTARVQRHLAPARAQHYLPPESRSRSSLTTNRQAAMRGNQPRTSQICVMPSLPPRATRPEPSAPGVTRPDTYISIAPSPPPDPCPSLSGSGESGSLRHRPPREPLSPNPPKAAPHPPQPIVPGQRHERPPGFATQRRAAGEQAANPKMSDPRAIFEQTSKATGHSNEFRFE